MRFDVFDQPGVILVKAIEFRPMLNHCPIPRLQGLPLFESQLDEGIDNFIIFAPPAISMLINVIFFIFMF